MIKLAIHGAAGRMGQRVDRAGAARTPQFKIVAALESAEHPKLGQDAGLVAGVGELGVPLAVVGESDADVVIDFSVPDAAIAVRRPLPRVQQAAGDRHDRLRARPARATSARRPRSCRSSSPPA